MAQQPYARRGEVWWFDPDPVRGTELGHKARPALVVSDDQYNRGRLGKIVVVPATMQEHPNPLHVRYDYRFRGRPARAIFCCDDVRAIDANERLIRRMWSAPVPAPVLRRVEHVLRLLLAL
jgi:mRNA interferase MazF